MNFTTGGQEVVQRLLEAYNVKTRQALCEILGVSKSTMATRFMRDMFPADWVLQAAIETGANIEWLSFGTGKKFSNENKIAKKVPSIILQDGAISSGETLFLDEALYPTHLNSPAILFVGAGRYLVDQENADIFDGMWLIKIDGTASIRDVMRLPQQKVRITNEAGSFDCHVSDVEFMAYVSLIMHKG